MLLVLKKNVKRKRLHVKIGFFLCFSLFFLTLYYFCDTAHLPPPGPSHHWTGYAIFLVTLAPYIQCLFLLLCPKSSRNSVK